MNLSRFYNRLKRYLKLDFKDKIIIIRIFILSAIARFAMLIVPFKILKRFLGNAKEESKYRPNDEEIEYIKKISTYIRRICKHTPWQSKCLVQAIIAQRLLVSKKIESTMYLGVGKNNNEMIAHAWVLCGDYYVSGWSRLKYGIVAKFRK